MRLQDSVWKEAIEAYFQVVELPEELTEKFHEEIKRYEEEKVFKMGV
jgi:hypothetical protein